jgi:membrane protein YdbS with pleckstrin-like domain
MLHLERNEHAKAVVRKHWFILFEKAVGLAVILVLPFVVLVFLFKVTGFSDALGFIVAIDTPLLIFFGASWVLVIWMKFFGTWTHYYLDVWVVTERRIIDIDQVGFFHRKTSSLYMEQIQDATIRVRGPIATLLDFGDIDVQTAGTAQKFSIHGIPHPKGVKELILKLHRASLDYEGGSRLQP